MSIKLAKDKTLLESNLERIDEPLNLLVNKIVSAISDLNNSFNNLWSLSDPEIEEIANYLGPVRVQETFEAHYVTGTALNTILSLRGVDSPRAVVVKPRDFVVDPDTGVITLVPLPVPEPVVVVEPVEDPVVDPPVDPVIPADPVVDPPVEEPVVPVDPPVEEPVVP